MKNNKKIPHIDPQRCIKCNECIAACLQKAIIARKNDNNYQCQKCVKYCVALNDLPCKAEEILIIEEKCTSCGKCIEICKYSAISFKYYETMVNSSFVS